MVGKRKANQMREKFAKMAKESEEEKNRGDKYEERRKEYRVSQKKCLIVIFL